VEHSWFPPEPVRPGVAHVLPERLFHVEHSESHLRGSAGEYTLRLALGNNTDIRLHRSPIDFAQNNLDRSKPGAWPSSANSPSQA